MSGEVVRFPVEAEVTHSCGHQTSYDFDDIGIAEALYGIERHPCLWCGGESGKPAPTEAITVLTAGDIEIGVAYRSVEVRNRLGANPRSGRGGYDTQG